jgi:hypothetical protein
VFLAGRPLIESKFEMKSKNKKSVERPTRRLNLFDEAVIFFTKGGWLGLKMKGAAYHILAGFTSAGMSIHQTIEHTGLHLPMAYVSNEVLERGLGEFFSEILKNEIDPSAQRFRSWTVLIPWSTSPDTPLARKLISKDRKKATLTFKPLIEMGSVRSLHALYDVIPMTKVTGRQFKWGLAYPTRRIREFDPRSMRWLHGWSGHYYMISDRKRNTLLRQSLKLSSG